MSGDPKKPAPGTKEYITQFLDSAVTVETGEVEATAIDQAQIVEAVGANDNDGGPDEQAPAAKTGGYSLSDMNEEFAVVLVGSGTAILHEMPDAPSVDRVVVRSIRSLKDWLSNTRTTTLVDGEMKTRTYADRWLSEPRRRQFRGLVFHPCPDEAAPVPTGYYNLWRGFAFEPKHKVNGWSIFADHIMTNICSGRQEWFDYVIAWMADIVQRPRNKPGVALVVRGGRGSGKTTFGEVFGALLGPHYMLVDNERYVTGNFNAHMISCLLLQCDEAVFAGDKAAEGRLKGLITASTQMIEQKGIDPIRIDNHIHLYMTSNEDYVVPAGTDERRFAVFEISNRCSQNSSYFKELHEQMKNGGYEALLFDLMQFDLSKVDLRAIPKTQALLDQKVLNLSTVDSWWHGRLRAGAPTTTHKGWATEVPKARLYDDYLKLTERRGISRRAAETTVGRALLKLMPMLRSSKVTDQDEDGDQRRVPCYILPDLLAARAAFDQALGQPQDWDDEPAPAENLGRSLND